MTTNMPWFHRTVIAVVNDSDRECVCHVQAVFEIPVTGEMDTATKEHIISVQTVFGLPITGAIDERTARQIERLRRWETL
jgi:hypothetical protein